jgi:hypothetical protein
LKVIITEPSAEHRLFFAIGFGGLVSFSLSMNLDFTRLRRGGKTPREKRGAAMAVEISG